MSWIGVLLVGFGVADLLFIRGRSTSRVPQAVGATVAILLGLLADLTSVRDLVALLVIAGLVVAWGEAVSRGFGPDGRAWVPLAVLGGALALALALSPLAGRAGGVVGRWLAETPVDAVAGFDPDRLLVLLGALLVQLSTGNVLVRLVLAASGTVNPSRSHGRDAPTYRLKGGRLLGPTERVFILGLGLAGQLTAAAIVVAAKGLIRWPELQAAREQRVIHATTEYFLVGSFVSWLVALGSLVLLA